MRNKVWVLDCLKWNAEMSQLTRPHSIQSSLYHYLVDHPKVLPASEKQIHYFKVSSGFFISRQSRFFSQCMPTIISITRTTQ
jgi:hypothetical protein